MTAVCEETPVETEQETPPAPIPSKSGWKEAFPDSPEIVEAVILMQRGCEVSAYKILAHYDNIIEQLVALVKHKQFNSRSYTQRSFLSYFAKSSARELRRSEYDVRTVAAAQHVMNMLEGFYLFENEEDIRQDVVEVLLYTLSKFRVYEGCSLNGYMNKAFLANLAARCKKVTKDPIVNLANDKIIPFVTEVDDSDPMSISYYTQTAKIKADLRSYLTDDQLGESWRRGGSCKDERLARLTPFERLLLKLRYFDSCSEVEIGSMLGYKQKAIRTILEKIRNKLGVYSVKKEDVISE